MDAFSQEALQYEFDTYGYALIPVPLLSDAECASFARAMRIMLPDCEKRLFNSPKEDNRRAQAAWHGAVFKKGSLLQKAHSAALRLENRANRILKHALTPVGSKESAADLKQEKQGKLGRQEKLGKLATQAKTGGLCTSPKDFCVSWQGLISKPMCKEQTPHVDTIVGFNDMRFRGKRSLQHRPFVLLALESDTRIVVWSKSHKRPFVDLPVSKHDRVVVRVPKGHALVMHGDLVHAGAAYKSHNVRLLTFLYARGAVDEVGNYSGLEHIAGNVRVTEKASSSPISNNSNTLCGKRGRDRDCDASDMVWDASYMQKVFDEDKKDFTGGVRTRSQSRVTFERVDC